MLNIDDRCGCGPDDDDDGGGDICDSGKSLLSAKLAANRESFVLEGKYRRMRKERLGMTRLRLLLGLVLLLLGGALSFRLVGRRVESPMVRVVRLLDPPQGMNA